MRSSLVSLALTSTILAAGACFSNGPRPPFDPSKVPTGEGFWCTHNNDTRPGFSKSYCDRSEAECVAFKNRSSDATRCEKVSKAFCFTILGEATPEKGKSWCAERQDQCDQEGARIHKSLSGPVTACGAPR